MWKRNRLSPEVQKKVDEYTAKLLEEQIKMARLVSHNLDYNFLQELINRVDSNNVVIDIKLRDGTELHIRKAIRENAPASTIGRIK